MLAPKLSYFPITCRRHLFGLSFQLRSRRMLSLLKKVVCILFLSSADMPDFCSLMHQGRCARRFKRMRRRLLYRAFMALNRSVLRLCASGHHQSPTNLEGMTRCKLAIFAPEKKIASISALGHSGEGMAVNICQILSFQKFLNF